MKQVLLLRTPVSDEGDGDAEGSADPYEAEFRSRGYHAVTVPLLRHELSLEGLESILLGTDNPADAYLGVVVTSKRGVEALVSAHNNLAARFPGACVAPPL
jgi:uroporphyrinogen-III synthase